MCAMLCALILVISMTLSVQGDRWSKQELRESSGAGQRCAADSAFEGEK